MTGARAFAVEDRRRRREAVREAQRPRILIDSREQTPLIFSDAVIVEHGVTLPTGDYSLAGFTEQVAIERKSKADFVACCGPERERFLEQIQRLVSYQVRALVIEATWAELGAGAYRSNMNPRSVTGTALAIAADHAIPVLFAGTARDASEMVERILTRVARNGVSA